MLHLGRLILFVLWVLMPVTAGAATYYVDWDTGTDCAPPTCGVVGNPWKSPWYADGQVASGDTIIISAKNDGSPYNNGTSAVLSLVTANTTWRAAPGETVRLSITATFGDTGWIGQGFMVVAIGAANIVVDGFHIWGQVHVDQLGDNSTIKNCDLSGGNGGRDNFPSPIYLHGSYQNDPHVLLDAVTGVLIQNNRIHDNVDSPETPGNEPLIMAYASRGTVVENNEFYGSRGPTVWWKRDPGDETVRYNYFHDAPDGMQGCSSFCGGWIDVYQNVFSTLTGYGVGTNSGGALGYLRVRNNTFYNVDRDFGWWSGGASGVPELFNNIHYHSVTAAHHLYVDESATWTQAYWPYLNYNDYFVSGVTTNWFINSANRASTLSGWQTWLDGQGAGASNGDDNSVNTDPGFLNGSGSFNIPSDFKRTSYPANGRGGAYPTVMGAYVTGNENIGLIQGATLSNGVSAFRWRMRGGRPR